MRDTIEVNGLVLSSSPVGEADRRVVLLTRELGRISCFAHGARKPTSRLVGATRPFASGQFSLYPGRDAYTLQQAEISEYFEPLFKEPAKTAYGSYFSELCVHFTRENSDEGGTAALLYYSLKALTRPALDDRLIRRVFELRLLKQNGLLPELTHCAKCGKVLTEAYFVPALMQAVCAECMDERFRGIRLSKSAVYALNYIAGSPVGQLYRFTVNDSVLRELSELAAVLMKQNLDRPPASLDMLALLAGEENDINSF